MMKADLGEARKRSVDNLQRLYTVVVSLAVTEALRRIMAGPEPTGYNDWLIFGSLIATVVPFYHGANRYLDATYVTGERAAHRYGLMIDFVALFIEGLLLFALAMQSMNPRVFYTILATLFVFDAVWVGVTQLIVSPEQGGPGYKKWAIANLAAAAAVLISIWSNLLNWSFWATEPVKNIALFVIVMSRSIYDYKSVWGFYYPSETHTPFTDIVAPRPAPPPRLP